MMCLCSRGLTYVFRRMWVLLAPCLIALPATAATLQVTTISDAIGMDGRCSLREAVLAANADMAMNDCIAGSGADTIVLSFESTFAITLAGDGEDAGLTGDFDVYDDLTIRPAEPGDTAFIHAMNLDRAFDVFNGARLTLDRIEVRGGDVSGFGGAIFVRDAGSHLQLVGSTLVGNIASDFGGAIFSRGPVTLRHSEVRTNQGSFGGGIYMSTASPVRLIDSSVRSNQSTGDGGGLSVRVLDAERSSITQNEARDGGGVHWRNDGAVSNVSRLVNTTVAENGAADDGGGLYMDSPGTVELFNVTVAWNSSDINDDGVGNGGGLFVDNGTVRARHSVVAANTDLSSQNGFAPDCFGTVNSLGHNLFAIVDGANCSLTGTPTGDLVGTVAAPVDHQLDCLNLNDGSTLNVAPLAASPVIDAGDAAGCLDPDGVFLVQDQRGHARSWDGPDGDSEARCDMGAVEFAAPLFNVVFQDGFESGDTSAWIESLARPRAIPSERFFLPTLLGPHTSRWRSRTLGGCGPE